MLYQIKRKYEMPSLHLSRRLLDARILRGNIEVPIDLAIRAIALTQPLIGLFEVTAVEESPTRA